MSARAFALLLGAAFAIIGCAWPLPCEPPSPFMEDGDLVFSRVDGARPCVISYDGLIWYRVGPGRFPPVIARTVSCPRGSRLAAESNPSLPAWSKPRGQTMARFAFVSFHEIVSRAGMQRLGDLAHRYAIPVTWMTGQPRTFAAVGDLYDSYHSAFGDDLQVRPTNHNPYARASPTPTGFARLAAQRFDWFRPLVAVEGSGYERDIASDLGDGYRAFWGIAWNSHGVDDDHDEGTPWGAYCADPSSYRRPVRPDGPCALVGLEWTARDLTRAAISGHEEYYSTDPDDLQAAGLDADAGSAYVRALVDAYAAAGNSMPLIMIVQQEADQMEHPPRMSQLTTSQALLEALFSQVRLVGMRTLTLADAAREARRFAGAPRAIAFPYIATRAVPEAHMPWSYRGPYPGTIDYYDSAAAMTFLEGRTTPVRVFCYDRASRWPTFLALPVLHQSETPTLVSAAFTGGVLTLHFDASVATHYGVALWSDPARSRWFSRQAVITAAGRAGAVAAFNLRRGLSTVRLHCSGCPPGAFPIAP